MLAVANAQAANKFMEVKTAYDLLVEGMTNGGKDMGALNPKP